MVKNAYIHVPFCSPSKCHYCSFVSYTDLSLKEAYLEALAKQINSEYKNERLNTLYFGGGTPSLLNIGEVGKMLDWFNFAANAEISFEVNPENVDFKYLSALRALGVNRLSIGAQTFEDKILNLINRKHTSAQIADAVLNAQEAGFDNVSLDFIYGLPQQGLKSFIDDLNRAIQLKVQHISLYGLKIDDNCYFNSNKPKRIADSDTQADMYLKAIETLNKSDFEHYEISNFSLKGFNSSHNLNYWNNNSYYGFGCSASGYVKGQRYQMLSDINKYIEFPSARDFEQKLEQDEILEEEIFLGLRKTLGINIHKINNNFGINFETKYSKILEKYSEFLYKTTDGYAFNAKGMLISNEILAEFIN